MRGRWWEGGGKVTGRWGGEMLGQYYKVQLDRSNRIPASPQPRIPTLHPKPYTLHPYTKPCHMLPLPL